MSTEVDELAAALHRLHGPAAEEVAKGDAIKAGLAHDRATEGQWLRVANFLARQRSDVDGDGAATAHR